MANFLKEYQNISIIKLESPETAMISGNDATKFIQTYVYPLVYFSGSILNILSVIVFYFIIFIKKEKHGSTKSLFKILFFKSLNDGLLFISNIFSVLYFCRSCESRSSLIMQIWNIGCNYYLIRVTELISIYLEILATLDILLSINVSFHLLNIFQC